MNRRIALLLEVTLIGLIILAWNWLVPSVTVTYDRFGREVVTAARGWAPGVVDFIAATIVLYFINWVHAVDQWVRRPVLRFGEYIKEVGPGLAFVEPLFYTTLDDIPVQDVVETVKIPHVQTKDNVNVDIEAILTYRVVDVRKAVVEVEDVGGAVPDRAITASNDKASGVDLNHLLEERAKFGADVVKEIQARVDGWGVTIKALEIKALHINDEQVAQAIAMKARAEKEAAAELTRANMQGQIALALDKAAASYTPEGRWLKSLEVMVELCRSAQNNTILIPTDLQSTVGSLATSLAAAHALPAPQQASPAKPAK